MLRSLRARLLIASMTIAVGAVAATAWLTSRGTSEQVRSDVQRTLEIDGMIYEELTFYADDNRDWDDVDEIVELLAEETGRRIALTTMDGDLLADSAASDGDRPELPEHPAAVVDPANPSVIFSAGYDVGLEEDEELSSSAENALYTNIARAEAACFTRLQAPFTLTVDSDGTPWVAEDDDTGDGYIWEICGNAGDDIPVYPLTSEERDDRLQAAEEAAACFDDQDIPYEIVDDEYGVTLVVESEQSDYIYHSGWEICGDPSLLWAPGEAEIAAHNEITRSNAECLSRQGVPVAQSTNADGLLQLELDLEAMGTLQTWWHCEEENGRSTTAPAAQLYLGERDKDGLSLLNAGGQQTLLAAGLVAALALALSVASSRRVLRPVAALTDAANRMEAGDLSHRVDEDGNDEIARLAHAFNAMAGALGTDEEQRRRLVSDVAHELRTPLANIRGYVEAAQDGLTPSDPAFLSSLHEEAILLQRLVDDLQVLSLAEAGRLVLHRERVHLGELVEQTVAAHRLKAEAAEVDLVVDVPDDGAAVEVDPVRIRQTVGNLVTNAIRHTPPDGTVTVSARTEAADAVVEVLDTGEGIAPDHLPHVFDRFWRADASRTRDTGGSGLGLAICSQLVEHHGGTLTATSTLGEGSTFTIRLPAAAD